MNLGDLRSELDEPERVTAWRRRPLWLVLPVTCVCLVILVAQIGSVTIGDQRPSNGVHEDGAITARVIRRERGAAVVRWTDERRGRQIQMMVPGRRVPDGATTIEMIVSDEDPAWSTPAAPDPQSSLFSFPNAVIFALVLCVPWLWWWRRQRVVRRAAVLLRDGAPHPGIGVYARARWHARPMLHVYATDAVEGARPLCALPVIERREIRYGPLFPVEVRGELRPGGFAVATLADGHVVWPSRRSVLLARTARPARGAPGRFRRMSWAPVLGVLVGGGLLVMWSHAATVRGARDFDELIRTGDRVTAAVTYSQYGELRVLYDLPDEPGVLAARWIVMNDGPEVDVGDRVELSLPPDDPMAPVVVGDEYFSWFETDLVVAYVVIALIAALAWRGFRQARLDQLQGRSSFIVRQVVGWSGRRHRRAPRDHPATRLPRLPTTHLRARDGRLVGPRSIMWWHPQLVLAADGIVLRSSAREHRRGWDLMWGLTTIPTRLGCHLAVEGNIDGASGRVAGWRWDVREAEVVLGMVEYLRGNARARASLDDPEVVAALADAIASQDWSRSVRPQPWFSLGDALDRSVERALDRLGIEHWRGDLIGGHRDVAVATLAAEIGADGVVLDGHAVSAQQVYDRAEWWLTGPKLPFYLLEPVEPIDPVESVESVD